MVTRGVRLQRVRRRRLRRCDHRLGMFADQGHRLRRACVAPRGSLSDPEGHPFDDAIHRSDAGSHYTAIHYGETLMSGRADPVGRDGPRRARQCVMRDDDRTVQDRVHPRGIPIPRRSDRHPRKPGRHHLGVGGLVQRKQADAPARATSARGGRGRVLRSTPRREAHRSQVTRCAETRDASTNDARQRWAILSLP